jgi:hypothetical protein
MMRARRLALPILAATLAALAHPAPSAALERYVYEREGVQYPYTVKESGDNRTFEFANNPGREGGRLRAVQHVFASVYGDDSIEPQYREFFMKEGAKCFVFDGRFYAYRACFLPNDFSPGNENRFWGFTTRLPNALWFLARQLLPAVLIAAGLYFAFFGRGRRAD